MIRQLEAQGGGAPTHAPHRTGAGRRVAAGKTWTLAFLPWPALVQVTKGGGNSGYDTIGTLGKSASHGAKNVGRAVTAPVRAADHALTFVEHYWWALAGGLVLLVLLTREGRR